MFTNSWPNFSPCLVVYGFEFWKLSFFFFWVWGLDIAVRVYLFEYVFMWVSSFTMITWVLYVCCGLAMGLGFQKWDFWVRCGNCDLYIYVRNRLAMGLCMWIYVIVNQSIVDTRFYTHDLIKENDSNDHSCTPALHASICSCITCINLFLHSMHQFIHSIS